MRKILQPAALFAAIVSLTFASSVFAADPVNIEIMALEEEPGSMVLTVSAVDENGKPFPGLDPSSFNVWINDIPLIVKSLQTSTDSEPASVLLLLDASGSMDGAPIEQARLAISEFVSVLAPNDEVAVMTFSSNVSLVQDFTSDRGALDAAVSGITLTNDTALYDGVIAAVGKMNDSPRSRRLIVLLSDGLANINQGLRDASIQAARDGGVSFIAVGLGANTDRLYLEDLTVASGGSIIEAATPEELRDAYTSLAFAIRSQYQVVTEVPRSIDRTVAGTLKVHVIHRADNAFAERALGPLEGAIPPPFTMTLGGIAAGDRHNGVVEVLPAVQEGIEVVKIDFYVDDEVVQTVDGVGAFSLDASILEDGSHVLKVVATDVQGREGEAQVPFVVPVLAAPESGASLPILPLLILAVIAVLAYFGYKVGRKRWITFSTPTYSRVDTWASVRTPRSGRSDDEDGDDEAALPVSPAKAETPPQDPIRGRVVIMDEAAVQGGELETIREFDIRSNPLTFGSGASVDMRVDDNGGLIAAEEARVWVQRGRLVYHKLTTLSAMATEGVTAGWQFLDDGDEMRIGRYRLIFQIYKAEQDGTGDGSSSAPTGLPQEHGMSIHGVLDGLAASPSASQPEEAPESLPEPLNWRPESDQQHQNRSAKEPETLGPAPAIFEAAPAFQDGSETESVEESAEASSWSWDAPAAPGSSDWTSPAPESQESEGSDWTPPTLEPRSADWLIEQSQPIEPAPGNVIQPGSWGGFVSSNDEGAPSPSPEDETPSEEDGEDRAWGT